MVVRIHQGQCETAINPSGARFGLKRIEELV